MEIKKLYFLTPEAHTSHDNIRAAIDTLEELFPGTEREIISAIDKSNQPHNLILMRLFENLPDNGPGPKFFTMDSLVDDQIFNEKDIEYLNNSEFVDSIYETPFYKIQEKIVRFDSLFLYVQSEPDEFKELVHACENWMSQRETIDWINDVECGDPSDYYTELSSYVWLSNNLINIKDIGNLDTKYMDFFHNIFHPNNKGKVSRKRN